MQDSSLTQSTGGLIRSCTCLYIKGWPPSTSDLDIRRLIAHEAGIPDCDIVYCQAILCSQTGQCKGHGFAKFRKNSKAQKALEAIQQLVPSAHASPGRLKVDFAKEPEQNRRRIYLWNLPVESDNAWINEFLVENDIFHFVSAQALKSNPKYSIGFVNFETEKQAEDAIRFINFYGLSLSIRYKCSGRIAAKFANKRRPQTAQPSPSRLGNAVDGDSSQSIRFEDIIQPDPLLSEISSDPFALKDAENPFKWNAPEGSDKNLEDVIDTVTERLELEPMLSSVYKGLLASYHATKIDRRKLIDFSKAREYLKQARTDSSGENNVRCDFVLDVIDLNLDEKQRRRPADYDDRLRALADKWNNPNEADRKEVRVNTFYVKALAFFHLGINKYREAEEAVTASLRLRPDNFMCAYLLAYIWARNRRHVDNRQPASQEELVLWERSYELASKQKLHEIESGGMNLYFVGFQVNYAEAIMNNQNLRQRSEELATEALQVIAKLSTPILDKHYRIAFRCEKVFRVLKHQSPETDGLLKILSRLKDDTKNSDLLLRLAKLAREKNKDEDCEALLVKAQELAYEPGHIWVDMYLQEFRAERPEKFLKESILDDYDTITEKYRSDYPRYEAVSLYSKGAFLATFQQNEDIDSGFDSMVEAVEVCSDVRVHFPRRKIENTLKILCQRKERPELEAWFRQHMMNSEEPNRISELYRKALESKHSDHQLAYEHLGLLNMNIGRFQEAVENFRSLKTEHPRRNSLISSALLKRAEETNGTEKREFIVEALRLGCQEACQPARLLLYERSKHCLFEAINEKYSPGDPDKEILLLPWLFSRDSYELLALIDITQPQESESPTDSDPYRLLANTDLQKSRLHLERLEQSGQRNSNEYFNAVCATLQQAKKCMDGLIASFDKSVLKKQLDHFPYGFNYRNITPNDSPEDIKKTMQALTTEEHEKRCKKIRDKMSSLLKVKDSASEEVKKRLKAIRNLLLLRECKAFRDQVPGAWLAIWQQLRHKVEHSNQNQEPMERFIPNLLKSWGYDSECAGSIAHMAAEFFEETKLILEAKSEQLMSAVSTDTN